MGEEKELHPYVPEGFTLSVSDAIDKDPDSATHLFTLGAMAALKTIEMNDKAEPKDIADALHRSFPSAVLNTFEGLIKLGFEDVFQMTITRSSVEKEEL